MAEDNLWVNEQRSPAELLAHPRNPRTHSTDQVDKIVSSMREFGFTNPVLLRHDGTIIAGHGRVAAAMQLGLDSVPCRVRPSEHALSEGQELALLVADNKLAELAGWDDAALGAIMADLRATDFDVELTGFSMPEVTRLLDGLRDEHEDGEGEDDDESSIPSVPSHPVSRKGDVWLCGPHRIMCGDCRDDGDVGLLMAGNRINLAFTSPPYADRRDYDASSGFRPIRPDDYVEWFAPVAANVQRHLVDDGSWFVNIKPGASGLDTDLYVLDLVLAHAREWGWHFATEFCWERHGVPKQVTQRFKNQFEPVYQFALNKWKMRPEAVRHASDNVPVPFGPGAGKTDWRNEQGGRGAMFGAQQRRGGSSKNMAQAMGTNWAPGEYIQEGLAYPGNRLKSFASTHEALGHNAAFPVGLPEFFIKAYTDDGDTVYDPFMGSGSTLIAAHRQQRRGFGMEISPAYCDVIIARWMRESGDVATREGDGAPFRSEEAA